MGSPPTDNMCQDSSSTGTKKNYTRKPASTRKSLQATYISVRSFIRTRTRKSNELMAPLVNHKTANWWREKKTEIRIVYR